jgi:hypothetical protein
MKIKIIIVYLGKLPDYFRLFLHSCSFNPMIDFLIFTDAKVDSTIPDNVKIEPMTLSEFKVLVEQKTGLVPQIDSGYKLCDFKPLTGFLFQEYLHGYDFWGHSDFDLVLGDIRFFTEKFAWKDFDIISLRKEWLSGSFALYRNIDAVNELFKKSKDWEKVVTAQVYFGLDECSKPKTLGSDSIFVSLVKGMNILNLETEIESMTHLMEREKIGDGLRIFQETLIKESLDNDMLLKFDKGKISMNKSKSKNHTIGTAYLHYHYITEKRNRYFRIPKWLEIPDVFYIDNTGFYREEEIGTRFLIRIKRIFSGNLFYLFRILPKKLKNKIFRR